MNASETSQPDISIIVAICDGGDALRNCLEALAAQSGPQRAEVIVPYDQLSGEAAAMAPSFPDFAFLDLGVIADGMTPRNALELHRFWDIRRSEGIKIARGRLIGLVEDRGIPAHDWAMSMIELHREIPAAAIGGCADNGFDTIWNWAIHFCDFGRYMAPSPTAESDFLSATNVCYDAVALQELRHLYDDGFYEPSIHAVLKATGKKMILSDRPRTTEYRPRIPTTTLAAEWYEWGRRYARIRSGEVTTPHRIFRALVTPALPFALFFRHLGVQRQKEIYLRKFWLSSPLVFMIGVMWAIGELIGYGQGPKPEGL